MDELGYTGEIRIFGGYYPPVNWAYCSGQLLNIQQYSLLFKVIGNKFGGNGTTTFALPDLQGKAPLGMGAGPALTPRTIGETAQNSGYTLNTSTMASHSHVLNGTSTILSAADPTNAYNGSYPDSRTATPKYNDSGIPNGYLDPAAISPAGTAAPAPVSVMQPFLAVGFAICLSGEFPHKP